TTAAFAFGHTVTAAQANFNLKQTTPVGSYPRNGFGLADMHGNVWEWCADWYEADYYSRSPRDDPEGPANGSQRGVRGGAWSSKPRCCRSARRWRYAPDHPFRFVGFRVACSGT